MSRNIYNNVALLKSKILDNYNTLKISKNNYFNTFKKVRQSLSNEKTQKDLNKEINKEIYKLKNDIDKIQDKIKKYNNLTEIYNKNSDDLKEEVLKLKKEAKNLPEFIND